MKNSYIVIGIIVIAVLGYWALGGPIPFTGGDDTQQEQQRPAFVPSEWKEFRNQTVGLAMYVPADASTELERDLAKVQVLGPDNQPNTEVTDGITFYAGRRVMQDNMNLEQLAQREFARDISSPTTNAVAAPSASSTAMGTMYTYRVSGPSGGVTQRALWQADDDTTFVTTAIVADPEDRGYAGTVDTIQRSLSAVPITANNSRISVQERFGGSKIVYTTDVGTTTAPYEAHCTALKGTFNECGSVCGPDADACASVCALTCNLAPRQ